MYERRFNPYATNIEIVKGYLKSGKVLALGILYLLTIAAAILTVVLQPVNADLDEIIKMLQEMGVDTSNMTYAYSSVASDIGLSSIVATAIASAVILLAAIAFFIMFAKSRSADPDADPVAGVTIMRVFSMISFVCAIVLSVICVIVYLAAYFMEDTLVKAINFDGQTWMILFVILGILLLIFIFFLIFSAAAYKNFYRSVKRSLTTVRLETKGSVAYGVLNILAAILKGLSLIGYAIILFKSFNIANLLAMIVMLLAFLINVFTASLALGYNRYIKQQKLGYNNTPYGGRPNSDFSAPRQNGYDGGYQKYTARQQSAPAYQDHFSDYNLPEDRPSYCTYCGAEVDGSAPFCSNCGNKL